jgi:hypothetical protein
MPANTLIPRGVIGLALLGVALFASVDASARDCRTIEQSFDAAGLEKLAVSVHVGELDVQPSADGQVHVSVEVCSRNTWFGLRKSKVDTALMDAEQAGGKLELGIRQDKFEEKWTVRMPATLALGAELGVGAMTITGLSDDISLEVGVGDAEINGKAADYGHVSGEAGVGDIALDATGGERRSERAVVSDSLTWVADGAATIEAEVGVGDVQITLE